MDLYAFEPSPDAIEALWDEREVVGNLPASTHVQRGLRQEDTPLQPGLVLAKPIAMSVLGLPVDCKPAVAAALSCIIANVCELSDRQSTWLFYSRDNNHYANLSRYVPYFYRRPIMIEAMNILVVAGLVVHEQTRPSPNAGYRSRIRPTQKLKDLLSRLAGLQTVYTSREVIVLRGADGKPQSYRETKATSEMRRDVLAHNEFLQGYSVRVVHPDVAYDPNGLLTVAAGERRTRINTARNAYYRVFNENFDRGGRWYGSWWQSLPSRVRVGIRINGEETCELLNASSWPSARGALIKKLASRYGPSVGTQVDLLRAATEKRYPALGPYWNSGFGLRLQNIDATICAEVQRQLRAEGIPCLSIHDSFIVPRSAHDRTIALMNEQFASACAKLALKR